MNITEDMKQGLNVAFNEAQLLGIEFSREKEVISATIAPLAIDKNGNIPTDNRIQCIFKPVGKLIASYRLGSWDDANAEIVKFDPEQISSKVEEFQRVPVYGWDFIDSADPEYDNWKNRLSFEYISENSHGLGHTMDLFQEGDNKHINIRIWFDDLELYDSAYEPIALEGFIENGKRAWDGIHQDKRTSDTFGIYPLKQ